MGTATIVFVLVSLFVGAFCKVPSWHRRYDRRLNALETKVNTESIEFRDDIMSLHDQIGENSTSCACDSRVGDIDNVVEDVDQRLNGTDKETAPPIIVDTLLDGFREEKEHVRRSLSEFEDMLKLYPDEVASLRNVDDTVKGEIATLKATVNAMKNQLDGLKQSSEEEAASCKRKIEEMKSAMESEDSAIRKEISDKVTTRDCSSNYYFKYSFGKSCYFVGSSRKTWEEARDYCRYINGHLVEVDTPNEDLFIYLLAKQRENVRTAGGAGYWLGASDIAWEGSWTWDHTGRDLDDVYTGWARGEPNGGRGENCLALKNGDYEWNDDGCDEDKYYICEE